MVMIGHLYPWQEGLQEVIAAQVARDRLHHALLLIGEPGIGKLDFALRLAAFLLCRSPKRGSPCGDCAPCHLVAAGTHPDLYLVAPEESRFIVVEQIRALVEWVAQTAQQGGRKVVILHPAEMINHAASNALLKCLEEPAPGTTLVLVCSRLSALLPTVRSRCQRFSMAVPPREMAEDWLHRQLGREASVAPLLDYAQNRPLKAREIAEGPFVETRKRLVAGLLGLSRDEVTPVACVASLGEGELDALLNLLLYWLGDLLSMKLSNTDRYIRNRDLARPFAEISGRLSREGLLHMIDRVNEERGMVASAITPNRQLILESLMIEWAAVAKNG